MDKKETAILLMEMDRLFPGKVKLEGATVETWYRLLKTQNYSEVLRRLDEYVKQNKFPPTVHDLYEVPRPEHNKNVLKQIKEWEGESTASPRQKHK